ncbi:MAG: hypothetical protein EA416_01535 [Trueperaceae bacterium]|nr:MAG: hypothetical protein EA416_01535 [Trueperaceae bacterium]
MTIHHRIRFGLALTLAALAMLTTLAAAQATLNVPSHGFQVMVPAGWEVDDDSSGADALFFLTSPDHAGGVVVAAGPLEGDEGAAYRAEGLAGLADLSFALVAGVPGVQRGDVVRTSVAGLDAAGFTFRGSELGGRFVYFVSDASVYAFGSIADAAAAATMEAALDQVLASVQLVALGFPDGGAPATDPFVGTFTGDGLTLVLSASGDGYVGDLTFSGQTYAVQAHAASDQLLTGTFVSGGTGFGFELVRDGDARVFTTGNSRYVLR